jgi:hypothetical protein
MGQGEGARVADLGAAHAGALLGVLAALREGDELVDCVLALGPGDQAEMVPLHAVVGAAFSPHLRSALQPAWAHRGEWRGREVWRVDVPGEAPPAAVRALVGFMYSGLLRLGASAADVAALWAAADYLLMGGVAAACEGHLRATLSPASWAEAREAGERFSRPALSDAALEYAALNLGRVSAHRGVWDALSLAAVQEVVRREDAGGGSEDEVLEAVLAWAEAQVGGGAAALAAVLPLVRLPQLSQAAKLLLRSLLCSSITSRG